MGLETDGFQIDVRGDDYNLYTLDDVMRAKLTSSQMTYGVLDFPVFDGHKSSDDQIVLLYEINLVLDSQHGLLVVGSLQGRPEQDNYGFDLELARVERLRFMLTEALEEKTAARRRVLCISTAMVLTHLERWEVEIPDYLDGRTVIGRSDLRQLEDRLRLAMSAHAEALPSAWALDNSGLVDGIRGQEAFIGPDDWFIEPIVPAWIMHG